MNGRPQEPADPMGGRCRVLFPPSSLKLQAGVAAPPSLGPAARGGFTGSEDFPRCLDSLLESGPKSVPPILRQGSI